MIFRGRAPGPLFGGFPRSPFSGKAFPGPVLFGTLSRTLHGSSPVTSFGEFFPGPLVSGRCPGPCSL